MSELRAKYQPNEKLERWLDDFTEDLIANFNVFLAAVRDDQADVDFSRYEVNAFVCNNPNDGAPVISAARSTMRTVRGICTQTSAA